MRFVHVADDGAAEIRWMWLPVFIGQNHAALKELGEAWQEQFPEGVENSDEGLDALHEFTITWLCQKFPGIEGLESYLRGIENVEE